MSRRGGKFNNLVATNITSIINQQETTESDTEEDKTFIEFAPLIEDLSINNTSPESLFRTKMAEVKIAVDDLGLVSGEEDLDFELMTTAPPDLNEIKMNFKKSLKPEFATYGFAVAAQMACGGFVGSRVDDTVKLKIKGKELRFADIRKADQKFDKTSKDSKAINPRRVCMAYADNIRKYIEKKKIITTTMKKTGHYESYMFIGGQASIKTVEDARDYIRFMTKITDEVQVEKIIKYFRARRIAV
jgi:hypothetical protein